jgi:glutathione S-transferase
MTDIYFHHYDMSPFSELVRLAFGLKQLPWKSVQIPMILPKSDLVALTGGYARTPVLQIGAEIYCDTAAILDVLETLHPAPSLYPAPLGSTHRIIADWAGGAQFGAHVGAAFREAPPEALPPGFVEDRKKRFVGFDFDAMPLFAPHLETQVLATTHWIDTILADGRHYIGGDAPGHGDFALYSNLWFLKIMPFAADFAAKALAAPKVSAWYDRITAIGHAERHEASGEDAITAARSAEPANVIGSAEGFALNQRVTVRSPQSTDDPVIGTLLRYDSARITVRRTSERAGEVNVHFPRMGQIVSPA